MVLGGAGAKKVGESGLWAMIERKLPGWRPALRYRLGRSKWVQGTTGK